MKKGSIFFALAILMLLGFSCIEEQDFGQYNDLEIVPEYESSIIYVEATEAVINQSAGGVFYSQDFQFNAFSEDFFAERVEQVVITYELINTTSKDLELFLEFMDESGTTLYVETLPIGQNPSAVLQRDVVFPDMGRSLDILTNTTTIRVSANNLGDTTSVSGQTDPLVILKSSGKFSIRIK